MKAHVDVEIRFKIQRDRGLHQMLRDFALENSGWEFPEEQSFDYQASHKGEAGFAVWLGSGEIPAAAIAIANTDPKHSGVFQVPNIVPRELTSLTLAQYNAVGLLFAKSFGVWLRKSPHGGIVRIVGPDRALKDIVPGEIARRIFEDWLRTPTPVSHPNDVYVLDQFICHLFRHRGKKRTWQIFGYLVEDKGWKPETAKWAVSRIEAGLELLRVDRGYR